MSSDAKEAYWFAVLGWFTLHGLTGVLALCTGAAHASVLGSLTPGAGGFPALPAPTGPSRRLRIV